MYEETNATRRIAIVGAGHWLITHDRIGPRVLEMVQGRYGPDVELVDAGTSGLDLLDHLHGQDLMFVVDACVYDGEPGEVRVLEPDLDAPPTRETSVHQIGPLEALRIGKHLYPERMPRRILLILVETNEIDAAAQETACVQAVSILDRELEDREPLLDKTGLSGPTGPASGGEHGSD